jgi:hypothetical protein
VFYDRKSFAQRTARGCLNAESQSVADVGDGDGATGRTHGKKSVDKMRWRYARLDALTDPGGIVEHLLIGATDTRYRPAARTKLGTYLQTDDERDRNRQNPEGNVRK